MADSRRLARLSKVFDSVCSGKASIKKDNARLFLEAMYSQSDAVSCVERLCSRDQTGLRALQAALFSEATPDFFNDPVSKLCLFLSSPALSNIHGGSYLGRVIRHVLSPTVFWNAILSTFKQGRLNADGEVTVGWFLVQVLTVPPPELGDCAYYHAATDDAAVINRLLKSKSPEARAHGHKIKHLRATPDADEDEAGGRHDNDLANFRKIAILPTPDELESVQPPFLRPATYLNNDQDTKVHPQTHFDNQFRLLREDMLSEIREETQIALGKKKGWHRGLAVSVTFDGLFIPDSGERGKIGVKLLCETDMWQFKKVGNDPKKRKAYLQENKNVAKHLSLTCLIVDGHILSFPTLFREEDQLSKHPPVLVVGFDNEEVAAKTFFALKKSKNVKLVSINCAVFAYEPILVSLQRLLPSQLVLEEEILHWYPGRPLQEPVSFAPVSHLIQRLRLDPGCLRSALSLGAPVTLDVSQRTSFIASLSQRLSLIQGPPGTGKSFIGALLAKALYTYTKERILVVCYTNHALDQFLEDLMKIGIPSEQIVRLGGKANPAMDKLSLYGEARKKYKRTHGDWNDIREAERNADNLRQSIPRAFPKEWAKNSMPSNQTLLGLLEFEDPEYYQAFCIPSSDDGMQMVARGKAIDRYYLLKQWRAGKGAGVLASHPHIKSHRRVWSLPAPQRQGILSKWFDTLLEEEVQRLSKMVVQHNKEMDRKEAVFSRGHAAVLNAKRIIAATTTGAAKYRDDIKASSPDVLLVEEAGEILESHIISAIGGSIHQAILIGDHKQLRPKVNDYKLTVEKGEGYDLNRSLFERLVLKGYPHHTLQAQHRMRPEISRFVREMTYPNLLDAPKTSGRADVRGLQANVVFIDHHYPEDVQNQNEDRSKANSFEADMVLRIVKYLGQQGYGTDNLVILTPYLGQLSLLRNMLSKTHDPVLNDLDSYDLVKAGLVPEATAKAAKKQIRLATIDNYQGEESEIVVASLTRSNDEHDIGFMSSPERLNVLLSRARDGLIIIGNSSTFWHSRKGSKTWEPFFQLLREGNCMYDGLPVLCPRHPDRTSLLRSPGDFETHAPEGGCLEPCGEILNCGIHPCPSKCHQLVDHSKIKCKMKVVTKCANGHKIHKECQDKNANANCSSCKREKKEAEEAARRAAEQAAHEEKMAELDAELERQVRAEGDRKAAQGRAAALEQRRWDIQEASSRSQPPATEPPAPEPPAAPVAFPTNLFNLGGPISIISSIAPVSIFGSKPSSVNSNESSASVVRSACQQEWERQKSIEGAKNPHIDEIMGMVGLERVKEHVLDLKAELEVSLRQGISMEKKNLNAAFLGNPGTGKTTIARLYSKFLSSMKILPGTHFVETSGSSLAHEGIPGLKKAIDEVLKAGGGTIFVDEAYQLTSAHNPGGRAVLDNLLTLMLDNIGKIVFLFAGYKSNMEKFFEANPGLPSRIPCSILFEDYEDNELVRIFIHEVSKRYSGRMSVEGGNAGLYVRIAIRRLAAARGRDGFGNARAVTTLLDRIKQRQAERITRERREGNRPDDFLFTQTDLIGPRPDAAVKISKAWKKLQDLIGLADVKATLQSLIDIIQTNYERELAEKSLVQTSLHRVFLGNPGTGKTTVANLYGQVLADLGMLSNGEGKYTRTPADFIGDVVGASEAKTKGILENSRGKVLVIDEAYGLYDNAGGSNGYKTAVIDTIVAEIQPNPGEDRCVLMLGYKEQMQEMFQHVNPGLSRRFAIEDAFVFSDFTRDELARILDLKLKDQDLDATLKARSVALEVLDRSRVRPHFGNAGEVDNMLGKAKLHYQNRQSRLKLSERPIDIVLKPEDIDPDFDRSHSAEKSLEVLFRDMVGADVAVQKLREVQRICQLTRSRGKDPRTEVPTSFIFKGPPDTANYFIHGLGTGKTSVARKVGKVYYDMGFLSSSEVIECSASDLVGQYVGQTAPKTRDMFDKALGKVLFIDEAYRLGEGPFAREAIDEMVDCLTKEKYQGRLIVILAGYEHDINTLLGVNAGLASRITDEIPFYPLSPEKCAELLFGELKAGQVEIHSPSDTDGTLQLIDRFSALASLPQWGNARDVKTLSKRVRSKALLESEGTPGAQSLEIPLSTVIILMDEMLSSMVSRSQDRVPHSTTPSIQPPAPLSRDPPPPRRYDSASRETEVIQSVPSVRSASKLVNTDTDVRERDPGVSDAIWAQLMRDRQAAAERETALRDLEEKQLKDEEDARKLEARAIKAVNRVTENQDSQKAKALEDATRRRAEQLRLEAIARRAKIAESESALKKMREEAQKESKVQHKLRQMGVCVAGFRWIKQNGGYRCAGGSHWVSDSQLGM
ncbi:P-loop containing nucleoside triphosphate hydrolase protein [Cantharellus anzutake]|uniref:P-loop containing nucleoside triphosphate hydrolase protein n=1 Tax=Cantharellus anzutake TaxID=1750568 RepID=UPI0019058466|nr:P-loop containing nucleoside triphosphate hydrolase protein [Cantharellus anzutake]KAF8321989.1 P-loop containing nucleoside triphosphate hydrolase protein [Cantharellus anzutake]